MKRHIWFKAIMTVGAIGVIGLSGCSKENGNVQNEVTQKKQPKR